MKFVLKKFLLVQRQRQSLLNWCFRSDAISVGQTMPEHLAGKLNMAYLDLPKEREQVLSLRLTLIPYLD